VHKNDANISIKYTHTPINFDPYLMHCSRKLHLSIQQ